MILILGKINKESPETKIENNKINLVLNDQSVHQYLYKDNNIYYIISNALGTIEKYITLCKDVEACEFKNEDGKLKTSITIGGIPYNNIFSL